MFGANTNKVKIRLSDDYNFYLIYNEGADNCDYCYIVKREDFDKILKKQKLYPVNSNGQLTMRQYMYFLKHVYNDKTLPVTMIDFNTTNSWETGCDKLKLNFFDKFLKALGGPHKFSVYGWGIGNENDDDANKRWWMYYRKDCHYLGFGCNFVLNGVRYEGVKFKSNTITNKIKNLGRFFCNTYKRRGGSLRGLYRDDAKRKLTEKVVEINTSNEYNRVIQLNRKEILKEARQHVPLQQSKVPYINKMYVLASKPNNEYEDEQNEQLKLELGIKNNKQITRYIDRYRDKPIKKQPLKIFLDHSEKELD